MLGSKGVIVLKRPLDVRFNVVEGGGSLLIELNRASLSRSVFNFKPSHRARGSHPHLTWFCAFMHGWKEFCTLKHAVYVFQ